MQSLVVSISWKYFVTICCLSKYSFWSFCNPSERSWQKQSQVLTRVNPDRNIFSINVELTSTLFTLQRFGLSLSPKFKFLCPRLPVGGILPLACKSPNIVQKNPYYFFIFLHISLQFFRLSVLCNFNVCILIVKQIFCERIE